MYINKLAKNVVVSCGPIPAKLDSVKYLTNVFKGGLAFETARRLAAAGLNVTIVKWERTELPSAIDCNDIIRIVSVSDVYDYFKWFSNNATNYDAFVMAAAVANLAPTHPYDSKFPSHLYKEGAKFNIEFTIAPRAIDIIKKKNKRCCLIGYKLFDADTDEELISAAEKTLEDSKANVVFANRPIDAKIKKIALTQDGSVIPMSFDEHIKFMIRAINQEYYKTDVVDAPTDMSQAAKNELSFAKGVVSEYEERRTTKYGTIAIKLKESEGFVITSRGHIGDPVWVMSVDKNTLTVKADGKPTLNAPALAAALNGHDYVIHKHEEIKAEKTADYIFPGTKEEEETVSSVFSSGKTALVEKYHGYIAAHDFKGVDWSRYYEDFPSRYFSKKNERLASATEAANRFHMASAEIGGNTAPKRTTYSIDPFVKGSDFDTCLSAAKKLSGKLDLIVAEDSINYLTDEEIAAAESMLKHGGELLANTFSDAPEYSVRDNEGSWSDGVKIHHYLMIDENNVIVHEFYNRKKQDWKKLGFLDTTRYKSMDLTYKRND